ncbi:AAA family ATPase [Halorarum halophilum]|uniref:AAA family ATPase n=1 Tax=Halorarum halophilum TaxID=2743090 RepID=A0A7D5K9Q7_9EURY|nr:AAA family ATPase [Halobaculum halophilum]QLG29314.1 AAA family ATPase [Halobaculum halophilum]
MDLSERIARRRDTVDGTDLIVDPLAFDPTSHVAEPVDRGPLLERLLDDLAPVFADELPPSVAVIGPFGVGKSAVVTALFDTLDATVGRQRTAIGTSTRSQVGGETRFVYVDARGTDSAFKFYRALLNSLTDDPVPERGVGTDTLRSRLAARLDGDRRAVVAVDHVDEPGTLSIDDLEDHLAPVRDAVVPWVVARDAPMDWAGRTTAVEPYRSHALVDVITDRASRGLAGNALDHGAARSIAEWADGNAHDALAALCCAATRAEADGADGIRDEDVAFAFDAVPRDGIHLARVFALPENRKRVLEELIALEDPEPTIADAAAAVAANSDLAEGTVTRFLYELAEDGVLRRVSDDGRTSHLEVPFPACALRRLRATR